MKHDLTRGIQAGIGTYFKPGVVSPLWAKLATLADEAVAWYLDQHVMDGYKFLMQNYLEGDKICIFGFSRGAYTARALAGMLHKIKFSRVDLLALQVGLLGRDNPEQVPFAYKVYKRTDADGEILAAGFKQTFARDVMVEFLGVFDTVASVGVILKKNLPFTTANSAVKTFRHALSLDERRAKFQPNLYHRPSPNPTKDPQRASPNISRVGTKLSFSQFGHRGLGSRLSEQGADLKKRLSLTKRQDDKRASASSADEHLADSMPSYNSEGADTDVLEVWFAGCHGDVGGGCVADSTPLSLAQIALHWMIREVVNSQCGILFDEAALERLNFTSNQFPKPKEPADDDDERVDAVQTLHDQLTLKEGGLMAPMWWLLELVPLEFSSQDGRGVWHTYWSVHRGKGRKIPDIKPNFHVTVRERMTELAYLPKAQWHAHTEVYVE
ncbi:hypothetical protein HWV62_101 [Athelia sp. TMB]|nr:hypothetical protein HWV62_101 [Athelia sp. TMB]